MKDKVNIGDVFTFRDYLVAKYGERKMIDGEEYTVFKNHYKTYHIRILDTDKNRLLFDKHKYIDRFDKTRRIRHKDNFMIEIISDLPFQQYSGPGVVRYIRVPGKAILSKDEMIKYLNKQKLGVTCGDNCSCYHIGYPGLMEERQEFVDEMEEYDKQHQNG